MAQQSDQFGMARRTMLHGASIGSHSLCWAALAQRAQQRMRHSLIIRAGSWCSSTT